MLLVSQQALADSQTVRADPADAAIPPSVPHAAGGRAPAADHPLRLVREVSRGPSARQTPHAQNRPIRARAAKLAGPTSRHTKSAICAADSPSHAPYLCLRSQHVPAPPSLIPARVRVRADQRGRRCADDTSGPGAQRSAVAASAVSRAVSLRASQSHLSGRLALRVDPVWSHARSRRRPSPCWERTLNCGN